MKFKTVYGPTMATDGCRCNQPEKKTHNLAKIEQESPPVGGAGRNATSLITQRLSYMGLILAITCSENVHA